jgi:hypothetical protein
MLFVCRFYSAVLPLFSLSGNPVKSVKLRLLLMATSLYRDPVTISFRDYGMYKVVFNIIITRGLPEIIECFEYNHIPLHCLNN